MANPEGLPLLDWLHQELDGAIGAANVPVVEEVVYDWFVANGRPRTASFQRLDRSELRERLGMD